MEHRIFSGFNRFMKRQYHLDERALIELSATGVKGLDTLLGGGLPAHRIYLVKGRPGVGKTTLGLQYLLEGVKRGERSLYITLSETREEIEAVATSHGWDMSGLDIFELSALEQQLAQEAQNTVFHPSELELNRTTEILQERIIASRPARLVIDSLSELRLLSDTPLRYRRQILSLKQFLAGRKITAILLDDHVSEGGDPQVQSIAHGVIKLEQVESEYGASLRRIKIVKVRGVNFVDGYHDAVIVPGGFQVFSRLIPDDQLEPFEGGVARSGVPALDELLGGGLNSGTSCLLSGPAGTGKSTLALQFALAAAARGEKSLVVLFEENRRAVLARAATSGMRLDGPVDAGLMELLEVPAAEIAPGQFSHMIRDRVENAGVRVVIIDSVNGYFEAMPDVKFLKVQLHDLFAFLSHHGVVTLITMAQAGIIGRTQSPVDMTYLADTVILLRYFEHQGRVRKAVSVIKKRLGGHENTLRELKINHLGIQVGGPLEEFQGVLTGVPTFTGKSEHMLTDE